MFSSYPFLLHPMPFYDQDIIISFCIRIIIIISKLRSCKKKRNIMIKIAINRTQLIYK